MKYKGYTGIVELDEESGTLFGRVIGLRDMITFQGESVTEVVQAFHDSVDDYLEFCTQRGESPEKPYSGQFVLRIDPQLHREMAMTAEAQDVSLNALVESTLKSAFPSLAPPVTYAGGQTVTVQTVTVVDAIHQAMTAMGGERSISEVERWISNNLGRHWADVGTAMADLTIDGNESSTYSPERRFLERVRRGVYRLADRG
jgi:predicted HicB family RNase H-like nuclease